MEPITVELGEKQTIEDIMACLIRYGYTKLTISIEDPKLPNIVTIRGALSQKNVQVRLQLGDFKILEKV